MILLEGIDKACRSLLGGRTVHALRDLTLTIDRGEVFGVAGTALVAGALAILRWRALGFGGRA